MNDKEIAIHTEMVLKLYFSNQDWKGYLDNLRDKEGVEEELSKIFKGEKYGQVCI